MLKVFASPSRYVQGEHLLTSPTGVEYIQKLGDKALLLADDVVWGIVGEELARVLTDAGIEVVREPFNGEASTIEINRVTEIGRQHSVNVVLALGGGKAIDAGKAIADELGTPIAVLPTTASTDAPTSALSVIYSEAGVFEQYRFYKKNPDLVLLDTYVIANSPARLFASGIADALATAVEIRPNVISNSNTMAGGKTTLAAQAIGDKCREVLFADGLKAYRAVQAKVLTPAVENVIEANTLLSGLGFESGGLAAAHAIHNGFTALDGDIHHLTHGEKVTYGTLTQLFLENRPLEEIDAYIALYQKLDLPTTLAELHLDANDRESLLKVGKQATIEGETIHALPFKVTPDDVADALIAVDAYVTALEK
ncbi:glycerol dehydrogenase [Aerococcus agrisoli]|jgi:glycerol dehydrogenase|uniref:Glycerol dehydrogenase n=1 Tax=Aerococcus agrisoli TaxID=2487350 RepID=A0A3N4GD06_9LACT|nr:glycerol dehydrogenase [Aerococcus agrisoli]RPA60662.1 glycerol dehydrogenase [Aerococcus agrisoli]